MERDPLLKQRWQEKAEHERGQEVGEKGIDLYYSFLERAQQKPDLKVLTDSLERAIGEYADSVIRYAKTKSVGDDYPSVQAADKHRHAMHEALIGSVNAISRWYAKQKIDNNWRNDIIGLDREDVGVWALSVARHVLGKEVEE